VKPVTTNLPRMNDSIRAARGLVAANSTGLTQARCDDAGLMVSELVTNALCHGSGPITLRITRGQDDLTVEVADEGHGTVEINATPGTAGGWGLRIVDELADAWGARQGSTCVWFRVRLASA
jgi:anti-sigma regulatory factor (Ser/Thr protein kinase)